MADSLLALIDFSDVTNTVATTAIRLAKGIDADVLFLHVGEPDPDFIGYEVGPQTVREDVARELKQEHRMLGELADRATADGVRCRALMVQGPTVETALSQAEQLSADWIVVGSHGHGALFNLLVGSVSEGVLQGAKCPVVVVPSPRK